MARECWAGAGRSPSRVPKCGARPRRPPGQPVAGGEQRRALRGGCWQLLACPFPFLLSDVLGLLLFSLWLSLLSNCFRCYGSVCVRLRSSRSVLWGKLRPPCVGLRAGGLSTLVAARCGCWDCRLRSDRSWARRVSRSWRMPAARRAVGETETRGLLAAGPRDGTASEWGGCPRAGRARGAS